MATNSPHDDLDLGPTLCGFTAGRVVFGRYRLDRILGRGGMGVVWLAHDQEMAEEIALKFLPEVVRLDALGLDELKAETRKSRKLTHRHIVRVHDFVSDAHSAGIAMEWVDGSNLSALRLGRPHMVFEPEELNAWVKQVCEALEYAHTVAKLIHRDLKPANIMLNAAGEVKVADFGISSSLTESASRVSARRSASGTLAYMSPQQALGERPTVADDVYSLGATLYELIAGKPPFFRGDLYAQVRDVAPSPMAERRVESEIPAGAIPEPWERTVAACLEKDPAKRPRSAMEVAWRLGLAADYEPRKAAEIPKPKIVRVKESEAASNSASRRDPMPVAAGAPGLLRRVLLFAAVIVIVGGLSAVAFYFGRPHPAPVAQNSTQEHGTYGTNGTSGASAVAQTALVSQSPAPPSMAASAAPSASGTQAAPAVDRQLIGSWQSGSSHATRKHWELHSDGRYLLSVAGTVTDSGTMSAANGHIRELSKNSPQPADVTYAFDDGDVVTQGAGPFDDVEWHRIAASSSSSSSTSSSHRETDPDSSSSDDGGGIKQQMLRNFGSRYGF